MLLTGKNVVLTGANRGIGKAILLRFAENGANIWACARCQNDEFEAYCYTLEKKYKIWVRPIYFDLINKDEIKNAFMQIKAEKKRIDILINNAGMIPPKRLFQMTPIEDMHHVFEVNFFSAMRLIQTISKVMVRQKAGSIVNIVSIAALDGEPAQVEYVASKAALIGATKKLASELGAYGIRVNAVAPGVTQTDMAAQMETELLQSIQKKTIMKRLAKPEEIANAVLFLASDLSSYMTGQILRVDGGIM